MTTKPDSITDELEDTDPDDETEDGQETETVPLDHMVADAPTTETQDDPPTDIDREA